MKVGDLVKRKPAMGEWVKYNSWMTTKKEKEIGIVLEIDQLRDTSGGYHRRWYSVHWSRGGVSWEDELDVERINEISKR